MQRSATISVVMATYNGSRYLGSQLDSLLAQRRLPEEIIVADDRSDDDTCALVGAMASETDVPIRLRVNPTRYGYADNFLRAARHATGDWVAFCDQDDVWGADKLARCSSFFHLPGVLAVSHRATVLEGSETSRLRCDQGIARTELLSPLTGRPWRMFAGFSLVFRRELITQFDFTRRPTNPHRPEQLLPHDEWISFLALSLGKVAVIAEPLVAHRHHDQNASRASWAGLSIRTDARTALGRTTDDLVRARIAADDRADFLEAQVDPGLGTVSPKEAAQHYRRVAALARARQPIWSAPTLHARGRALLALWAEGGYAAPRHGGGRRELAKDLLLGMLRSQGVPRRRRNEHALAAIEVTPE